MAGNSGILGLQRKGLDLNGEQGCVIMPGDEFQVPKESTKLVLGPGLRSILDPGTKELKTVVACKAGILKKAKPNTFFIELKTRSVSTVFYTLRLLFAYMYQKWESCLNMFIYFPKQYQSFKKDDVVGIIKQKSKGEHYSIDVACREHRAQLSKNAFEGATKRYRPDLQVSSQVTYLHHNQRSSRIILIICMSSLSCRLVTVFTEK